MNLRIIGLEGQPTQDEIAIALVADKAFRAKTPGKFALDGPTGARVVFDARTRTAKTTPSPHDYILASLPNPIPHRAVIAGVGDDGFGTETHVVASDGTTLAREAQTAGNLVPGPGDGVGDTAILSQALWSGGDYIDVFKLDAHGASVWSHKLSFDVPEDCVAPAPLDYQYKPVWVLSGGTWVAHGGGGIQFFSKTNTDVFVQQPDGSQSLFASNATVSWPSASFPRDSLYVSLTVNGTDVGYPTPPDSSHIATDWAAGQAAFRLRRKNLLKKNSDTVLASLAAGAFSLPRQWDSLIKGLAPVSNHTSRPVLMDVALSEVVKVDTPANINQVGEKVTERTATFHYSVEVKQPDGSMRTEEREQVIVGTLKYTLTPHLKAGFPVRWTHRYEHANWHIGELEEDLGRTLRHQLALDTHLLDHELPNAGMGLLWNGVIDGHMPGTFRTMWFADSSYLGDSPINAPFYNPSYAGYSPALMPYSNTLAGTAPRIVLDYRKAVPIRYDANAPGNTAWNDSALQDGQVVTLILFGPAGKGIFGEWDNGAAEGDPADTAIDVYGAASFRYEEGIFTFKRWQSCKGDDGATLPPKDGVPTPRTISLGDLPQPTTNCILKYEGIAWPDVKERAKEHVKAIREGNVEADEDALLFKAVLDAFV